MGRFINIRREQLADDAELLKLFRAAVLDGLLSNSTCDLIAFFGAAVHALRREPGDRAGGLFASAVRSRRFIVSDDEEREGIGRLKTVTRRARRRDGFELAPESSDWPVRLSELMPAAAARVLPAGAQEQT